MVDLKLNVFISFIPAIMMGIIYAVGWFTMVCDSYGTVDRMHDKNICIPMLFLFMYAMSAWLTGFLYLSYWSDPAHFVLLNYYPVFIIFFIFTYAEVGIVGYFTPEVSTSFWKKCYFLVFIIFLMVCLCVFLSVIGVFAALLNLISLDLFYFGYLTVLILYFVVGVFLYFGWGFLGVRGIFYLAEFVLILALIWTGFAIDLNVRTQMSVTLNLGMISLSDIVSFCCLIRFDLLSLLCIGLVLILTGIILIFGIEYMTREALAYNVVTTLIIFSACIVWFFLSYAFGIMTFFWECAGIFSLLLIDMYYARIRTTQAVSRSFAITRFSDLFVLIAGTESYLLCGNDTFSSLFSLLPSQAFTLNTLFCGLFDVTIATLILFSIFVMSACKCAQFFLFVWLPDAMEAPTPASALIHSSTLVVMGIFLLLRMSSILHLSFGVLTLLVLTGSLSTLYGAVFATQTNDLKKAVAYSTISQIGYMFCGCGLLAFREVLLYLVVHAICKALLFVFVGYIVHMFGGTTSLRRMGGLFYIIPDTATYVFILCLILAGAPYTLGYCAKELLVSNVFSSHALITTFMRCCWIVAFFCTPIYLHRICIIPLFGRPRSSWKVYRNILNLKESRLEYSLHLFDLSKLNSKVLLFFSKQARAHRITGPLASILHFIILIIILFCGEHLFMLIGGFYNTAALLFTNSAQDLNDFAVLGLLLQAYYLTRNIVLLIFILFLTVVFYFMFLNNQSHFTVLMHCICVLLLIAILLFGLGWVVICTVI